jgi:hypothetical protein
MGKCRSRSRSWGNYLRSKTFIRRPAGQTIFFPRLLSHLSKPIPPLACSTDVVAFFFLSGLRGIQRIKHFFMQSARFSLFFISFVAVFFFGNEMMMKAKKKAEARSLLDTSSGLLLLRLVLCVFRVLCFSALAFFSDCFPFNFNFYYNFSRLSPPSLSVSVSRRRRSFWS